MMGLEALKTELRRLRTRVAAMVARGVISSLAEGGKTVRLKIEILDGEVEEDVELLQPYGFHISPPAGSEVIALGVAGARSNTVAICPHHPDQRPKNAASKTGGLYTNGQWRVFIDANGVVHLGAESGAQFVALAQKVLDELNSVKSDLDGFKTTFDGHTHAGAFGGTGSAAALTSPPSASPAGTPATAFPTPHTPASVAASKAKAT